jgi:hypothetical protein
MKFAQLSALAAVLFASAAVASADTVQLISYGTNVNGTGYVNPVNTPSAGGTSSVNNAFTFGPGPSTSATGQATYDIVSLNPGTWATPLPGTTYVSYADTAPGGTAPFAPNSTTPYTFTSTFNIGAGNLSSAYGSLFIYADDAVTITLNGNTLLSQPLTPNYANFQAGQWVSIAASDLVVGTNTLVINDYQLASYNLGFDLSGSVNTVPEPSTLMMLGTGLLGSAGALMRRMRS